MHEVSEFLEIQLLPGTGNRIEKTVRNFGGARKPKVAITLRRDEHLSIDIHQPMTGLHGQPRCLGMKDNQRGGYIHVAQFKALHGGA